MLCQSRRGSLARSVRLTVDKESIGPEFPFSGEKLSPVLTLYRYRAFDDALETVAGILDYQGSGHSCGIHSENGQHILALAHSLVG